MKKNFKFIVDFSIKNQLNNLSVEERVIYSSYLTSLTLNEKSSKNNLFNLIFNFEETTQKSKIKNYSLYDDFVTSLTNIMKNKLDTLAFIQKHQDDINPETKNSLIFRINLTEDDFLKIKKSGRMSYKSYLSKIYIYAVAKNKIETQLNEISINDWSNDIHKKRMRSQIEEYFKFMGLNYEYDKLSKSYHFYRSKQIKEVLPAKQKIEIENLKKEMKNIPQEKTVVKTPVIEKPVVKTPVVKKEQTIVIGEGRNSLNKDVILQWRNDHFCDSPNQFEYKSVESKVWGRIVNAIENFKSSHKDVTTLLIGKQIQGDDWKERKDTALYQLHNFQEKLCQHLLNNVHDKSITIFEKILPNVCANHIWNL